MNSGLFGWLLSLTIRLQGSFLLWEYVRTAFLCVSDRVMVHCMDIWRYLSWVCSQVDRHLDCFHFGALMNNNNNALTSVYRFLCGCMFFTFFLHLCSGVELRSYMVILCLTFWGTAEPLFQSGCNVLRSHQQLEGLRLSHILTNTCYSKPGRCWWWKSTINNYTRVIGSNWNIWTLPT